MSSRAAAARKIGSISAAVAAGSAIGLGASSLGVASLFIRRVITPDRDKPDDVVITAVDPAAGTLTLTVDEQTVVPGRYGLWLDRGAGHVRVGSVIAVDDDKRTVTRQLEAIDFGQLAPGPARWNQYYYWDSPEVCLGIPTANVRIPATLGTFGGWLVPPPEGLGSHWAILVHGRGARREECVRAIEALHDAGFNCLIPQYRNDEGAPSSRAGRYNLGLSEWQDVEAAVRYALINGATRIVLGGWSMGGAIVMQFLSRSPIAGQVDRAFFDAPVIDWNNVLDYQAKTHHLPASLSRLGGWILGNPRTRVLVGTEEVIDVSATNWVARADELLHPILLIHSYDDDMVPIEPALELAQARPDLVQLETWQEALHCQEWNTDTARWNALVTDFVRAASDAPGAPSLFANR